MLPGLDSDSGVQAVLGPQPRGESEPELCTTASESHAFSKSIHRHWHIYKKYFKVWDVQQTTWAPPGLSGAVALLPPNMYFPLLVSKKINK